MIERDIFDRVFVNSETENLKFILGANISDYANTSHSYTLEHSHPANRNAEQLSILKS